jgi:hypothetical protein
MTNPDTETAEGEDNVVVLAPADDAPSADADAKPAKKKKTKSGAKKAAGSKAAAKKTAAKDKPMTKKTAKKAAKPKAEKKAKPKAEKKAKRVPGTKAQTQVPVDAFKYVAKAAKEDGAKPADFVRDAVLGAIDKRFGTTYVKDAKAAAKAAA